MNTEPQTNDWTLPEDAKIVVSTPAPTPPLFDSQGNPTEHYLSLPRTARKALFEHASHPARLRAELASKDRKAKRLKKENNIRILSNACNLHFLALGRLTVCYRYSKNVLYISTALRNKRDVDNPLDARFGTSMRMVTGEHIVLPITSRQNIRYVIEDMFSSLVRYAE